MTAESVVGIIGNPNCGKSALFNQLTGLQQHIGNWPGVTIERKTGNVHLDNGTIELVDLPGTYSLNGCHGDLAADERVARDFLAERRVDLLLNVVDASHLERHLYLTLQLIEMRVPMVLVLNMVDVVEKSGAAIDTEALARRLNIPVIAISAHRSQDITRLKQTLRVSLQRLPVPEQVADYPMPVQSSLSSLTTALGDVATQRGLDVGWLSLRVLEGDDTYWTLLNEHQQTAVIEQRAVLQTALGEDIDICFADYAYGCAHALAKTTITTSDHSNAGEPGASVNLPTLPLLDRVFLNRWLGLPLFFLVMYLMFMFTINIGGAFVDGFDQLSAIFFVDSSAILLQQIEAPAWMGAVLAQGLGGGIQVVATFVPIVFCLFLFLSVLEDSGYLARAALTVDRLMGAVGLPGKALMPLIVGFGCNVPAVMATRTLEQRRDRILTIFMTPFMSCSARLPVYSLFAVAFFPAGAHNIVFSLYLVGIAVALLTGFILKHTLLRAEPTPYLMELPAYRLPRPKPILRHTWERTRSFLLQAGKLIIPMVMILNVLNTITTDSTDPHAPTVLEKSAQVITPLFAPIGLEPENWPATVGIFTGILAKEAVVGTLTALYDTESDQSAAGADKTYWQQLPANVVSALATIPANLATTLTGWNDPLGLASVTDHTENESVYNAIRERFSSSAAAYAYLLFILLYFPCVATLGVVAREIGYNWGALLAAWTTITGYGIATLYYQLATAAMHPLSSLLWLGGVGGATTLALWGLRQFSAQRRQATSIEPMS